MKGLVGGPLLVGGLGPGPPGPPALKSGPDKECLKCFVWGTNCSNSSCNHCYQIVS